MPRLKCKECPRFGLALDDPEGVARTKPRATPWENGGHRFYHPEGVGRIPRCSSGLAPRRRSPTGSNSGGTFFPGALLQALCVSALQADLAKCVAGRFLKRAENQITPVTPPLAIDSSNPHQTSKNPFNLMEFGTPNIFKTDSHPNKARA